MPQSPLKSAGITATQGAFRPLSKTAIGLWVAFFLWVAFVCFLSSLSASSLRFLPHGFKGMDKVVHFSLFFAGAFLLAPALRHTVRYRWLAIILACAVALGLFGVADEFHQLFTSGRSGADLGDWTADFLGALSGAVTVFVLRRFSRKTAPIIPAGSPATPRN